MIFKTNPNKEKTHREVGVFSYKFLCFFEIFKLFGEKNQDYMIGLKIFCIFDPFYSLSQEGNQKYIIFIAIIFRVKIIKERLQFSDIGDFRLSAETEELGINYCFATFSFLHTNIGVLGLFLKFRADFYLSR